MRRDTKAQQPAALRVLGWFWVAVLLVLAGGATVLQVLGPPPAPKTASQDAPATLTDLPPQAPAPDPARSASVATPLAARPKGAPIPAPDPALLEPAPDFPDGQFPRVAPDGRMPMQTYAAGWDPSDPHPRVAILLAGVGMSELESDDAIRVTPAAVSLAVSPYAFHPEKLLAAARAAGHEYLVSIPMEPQAYPFDDPGRYALMTGSAPELNSNHLEWILSRFAGYVGATGALNGARGERFANAPGQFGTMLGELASRGLLYVDPRPAAPPLARVTSRAVDIVIDEPAVRTEIETKLARLEEIARTRGSAIGLAGVPRPVTIDRIAAWASGLSARGLTLTPVSALLQPPVSDPEKRANIGP